VKHVVIESRESQMDAVEGIVDLDSVRVLHVISSNRPRGAQVFLRDLTRALWETGISQRVAVLRPTDGEMVEFGVPTIGLHRGRQRDQGFRSAWLSASRLRSFMHHWEPHVIHAHGGEPLKYAFSARPLSVPVVYQRIGSAHWKTLHGPRRAANSLIMRRASTIVAVAEAVRWELIHVFRVPPDRVRTIRNARDPRRLTPSRTRQQTRQALGIPPSAIVVLSIGALTWEKDPLGQLDVFQRSSAATPEALLLIAGEGPMRTDLEGEVGRRLKGRVMLLGARRDVPNLLAASDVLLLASATEAMPGVLIEAGMLGLPIVSYAIGGIPEVVVERKTGLLAPRGDRAGLAAQLHSLLRDEESRRSMGRTAMRRCRDRFDIRSVAPAYAAVYGQLTSR
jgi:glycosyltransferase involved in cell wall biosynthesis